MHFENLPTCLILRFYGTNVVISSKLTHLADTAAQVVSYINGEDDRFIVSLVLSYLIQSNKEHSSQFKCIQVKMYSVK